MRLRLLDGKMAEGENGGELIPRELPWQTVQTAIKNGTKQYCLLICLSDSFIDH